MTRFSSHFARAGALALMLLSPFSQAAIATHPDDLALDYYFDFTSKVRPDHYQASTAAPVQFDSRIPTPESVLGYQVGDWHVRHDQLVAYYTLLAEKSDRVSIEVMGYSHEQRPLLQLRFSTPERQAKLDDIRQAHVTRVRQGQAPQADDLGVIWMGYSVHGNEPSGANAAMLVAYYLAAANDERVTSLLANNIVLLDPALNPDGLSRFAQWANMHKGKNVSSDPYHREHWEDWPSGRTNHYWFDLNRDWLLLQHPESRARIKAFHEWMPTVLTDFHEMGPNSTYFFQPGIPTRKHPLTPAANVTLTKRIANFHAKALDKQDALYFTEESFDDFYYGKGSTYPDINGSIGILFEQASSRGHLQETINGPLHFAKSIKQQLITSLSTFDAAINARNDLLTYQADFYQSAQAEAKKDDLAGYILHEAEDATRLNALLAILKQHQINAYPLTKGYQKSGVRFSAKGSYFVPLEQAQYRLIKAIFSEQKTFQDNTFYDVSGWTLAHAFDVPFAKIKSRSGLKIANTPWQKNAPTALPELGHHYAYAFSWQDSKAAAMLNYLLQRGVQARVANDDFTVGERAFKRGAVVIPAGIQQSETWLNVLNKAQTKFNLPIMPLATGLSEKGIDLGSRQLVPLTAPKVLLLGGVGTSQYEVGEMWYYLDTQLGVSPTIVDLDRLGRVDLSKYTHIVMADGRYSLGKSVTESIKGWVRKGGVIVAHKGGAKWLSDNEILKAQYLDAKAMSEAFATDGLSYQDKDDLAGKKRIAGAIFKTKVDTSHPLMYGMQDATLPVFKNSQFVFKNSDVPFVTVAQYTAAPLLAGFTHADNVSQIANQTAMVAHSVGRGKVIAMAENPVFRGFWHGTSRLVANSLFFSPAFSARAN